MCTEQNVTVGVPDSEGRREETSNDEYHHAPRFLAGRGLIKGEDRRVRLEGVLVEQEGEVRVACVRNELVRDGT